MSRIHWFAVVPLVAVACGGGQARPSGAAGAGSPALASSGSNQPGPAPVAARTSAGKSGMQLFLLIGQSNMEGTPQPAAEDLLENPRVRVLGYDDFGDRKWNEWDTATPPLHRSWAGVGPGDSFGKAMAEAWPEATIGLVPCAISGVDIDFFLKGVTSTRRKEFQIPPDDVRDGAYDMVIERARLAQQDGVIRGILFHQGESDNGNPAWVPKVQRLVGDLRADLGLDASVPFLAGELLHTGCCTAHNPLILQLPSKIPNAHVVSAAGLTEFDDPWNAHFDLSAQREFGRRYAAAMLQALGAK